MNFDNTTILAHEPDMHQWCLLELWFIHKRSTINCEVGLGLGELCPKTLMLMTFF